jgi:hypothetical protein
VRKGGVVADNSGVRREGNEDDRKEGDDSVRRGGEGDGGVWRGGNSDGGAPANFGSLTAY